MEGAKITYPRTEEMFPQTISINPSAATSMPFLPAFSLQRWLCQSSCLCLSRGLLSAPFYPPPSPIPTGPKSPHGLTEHSDANSCCHGDCGHVFRCWGSPCRPQSYAALQELPKRRENILLENPVRFQRASIQSNLFSTIAFAASGFGEYSYIIIIIIFIRISKLCSKHKKEMKTT